MNQPITPFDWSRMLLWDATGVLFLLEVVFRTTVMYLYAVVFARFVGKRGVGGISPFEFIVIIIISSAAGLPMFRPTVPLLHGLLVLTVVMLLHKAFSYLTEHLRGAEDILEGRPVLLIKDGDIIQQALSGKGMSHRELLMALRAQGVRDVGEVERAFFEPSGQVSVFKAARSQRRQVESTLPSESQAAGRLA